MTLLAKVVTGPDLMDTLTKAFVADSHAGRQLETLKRSRASIHSSSTGRAARGGRTGLLNTKHVRQRAPLRLLGSCDSASRLVYECMLSRHPDVSLESCHQRFARTYRIANGVIA